MISYKDLGEVIAPAIPTALLAEYLALASSLKPNDGPELYRRANQLAFQLAMELPAELWQQVQRAVAAGTVGPVWEVVVAARGDNALTMADAVWHNPGPGRSDYQLVRHT